MSETEIETITVPVNAYERFLVHFIGDRPVQIDHERVIWIPTVGSTGWLPDKRVEDLVRRAREARDEVRGS